MRAGMRQVIPITGADAKERADARSEALGRLEDLRTRVSAGERSAPLYAALAAEHVSRGEFELAAAAYTELLVLDSGYPDALLSLGQTLIRMERWKEAAAQFRRHIEAEPRSIDGLLGLGECQLHIGEAARSIESFDRALAMEPGNAVAVEGRAAAIAILERSGANSVLNLIRETEAEAGAGPAPDPAVEELSPIEEGLAAAALAMGDWRAVIHHCSRIVQARPDHFEAWANLGAARQQVGEAEEAEFAYRQALRIRPDAMEPLVNLGMLRQGQGDVTGAREAYELALEAGVETSAVLWNFALVEEAAGSVASAELLLDRLTEREGANEPEWPEAWFRLGYLRLSRTDWEGAAAALAECVRRLDMRGDPWWEPLHDLGLALYRAGHPAEAMAALERALAGAPPEDAPDVLRTLAAAALDAGDVRKAAAARKRLNEAGAPCPELTFNIARWLQQQGRLDDAVRVYSEALKERPTFPEALLNLGHALHAQGREREAAECWRRALSMRPDLAAAYFEGGVLPTAAEPGW